MTFTNPLRFRRAPTPPGVEDFEAISHEFFETAYSTDIGPTAVLLMRLVDRQLNSSPRPDDLQLSTYELQARLGASDGDLQGAFQRLLRTGLVQLDTSDGTAVLAVPSHVKRYPAPTADHSRDVTR